MSDIELVKKALEYVSESGHSWLSRIVSSSDVKGERQDSDCDLFDHEFVDQHSSFEDCFHGTMYLPLSNGEYLEIGYHG